MATITYSVSDLENYKVSRDSLDKLVSSIGMEVEGLSNNEAVIDITPNRPDLLDIVGFTRALSLLSGKSVPKENFYTLRNEPIATIKVGGAVKKVRPFISAMVVKNLNLNGNRLKYLINFTEKLSETYGRKRRKLAMGLHAFSALKEPLTYDAAHDKRFVPLGSTKEMSFGEIMKRHKKGVQYSDTVAKDNPNELYPFLADAGGVMSLIPIINSSRTKISSGTKDVLVDVTGTSKNAVDSVLNMMACSFIDAGADVYPCTIANGAKSAQTPELKYKELRIKKFTIEKTLGVTIDENKMIGLANRMGYPAAKYGNFLLVYVPPYRLDVLDEQDVIEDMAIAYGYDRINPLPVMGFSVGVPADYTEYANGVSRLMLGLDYSEAMNMYLTNEKVNFDNMGRKYDKASVVSIAYAKTEAITMLRNYILPGLLQNLAQSSKERMPQRLFEMGSVFWVERGKVREGTSLGLVSEHSRANFSEAKSVIGAMMKHMGVEKYALEAYDSPAFIRGRCASITVNGQQIGYFGEIAPQVLENFRIEEPVVAAELRIDFIRSSV